MPTVKICTNSLILAMVAARRNYAGRNCAEEGLGTLRFFAYD
jgi:hypothetical protein